MVYISLSGDFLHHGHINVLKHARTYGSVTVGLLTDEAIATRKKIPVLSFEQRKEVIGSLSYVDHVVAQEQWSEERNVLDLRPNYVVHGDDWTKGQDVGVRLKVLEALNTYGGQLVEVPYTPGVSAGALREDALGVFTTPEVRRSMLRRILDAKGFARVVEAHSPLAALIAEKSSQVFDGDVRRFDGVWSSSLTDSTVLGKPDTEVISIAGRLVRVNEIFEVTSLPLVFDADTGGQPEHLELHIRSMERLGVSAMVIEDKEGLKKNSLLGNSVQQSQASVEAFTQKIEVARRSKTTDDFMVIARIESLILEQGMDDAVQRAHAYVAAGADCIMIHSRKSSPGEVFSFATRFRRDGYDVPLVCVPTTYSAVKEAELIDAGFNIVIYANHLLRASHPAMAAVADSILKYGRAFEAESILTSIDEILSLVPGTK